MFLLEISILLFSLLAGCASNVVDTDELVSNTVMLPPATARTVFIQNRNASDNQEVTFADLGGMLSAKGYQVLTNPDAARYVLLTNIVYCNETRPDLPVEAMVAGGFGSSLMSGLSSVAGMAGSLASLHPAAGVGVGVGQMAVGAVSSVVSGVSNLFSGPSSPQVSDEVIYACVADVQIVDRAQAAQAAPATASVASKPVTPPPGVYQTRLGASVHQKKLKLAEATPLVRDRLRNAIAGHF